MALDGHALDTIWKSQKKSLKYLMIFLILSYYFNVEDEARGIWNGA